MDPSIAGNIMVGTTRWLINDRNSDIIRIVKAIGEIPLVSINLDYRESPHDGLRAYERGYVKEGVGCGGSSVAAVLATMGRVNCTALLERIHSDYEKLMGMA